MKTGTAAMLSLFSCVKMNRFFIVIILFSLVSCASQEKASLPSVPFSSSQPDALSREKSISGQQPLSFSNCREEANAGFNRCGIDFFPFARIVFADIDRDGMQEMIAGSKDGCLRLYKNRGTRDFPSWRIVEGYFDGIKAAAFSSPAAGDIDNDGKAEILIGTGGFSSDSGKVIFFRNTGSYEKPVWVKFELPEIHVGNDAAPALVDMDNDGRLDIVIGNSKGELFLYRNVTRGGKIGFSNDKGCFKGINFGIYAAPSAVSIGKRTIVVVGNSMGKVYILERNAGRKQLWKKERLDISFDSFASPAFLENDDQSGNDLVFTDSSGRFHYFKNTGNYRQWSKLDSGFFCDRIFSGFASNPSISTVNGRHFMVLGNINGVIRLFEQIRFAGRHTWEEKEKFFNNIKLPGFSKGILADWKGKTLLITGQQDGIIRAHLNTGDFKKPRWIEQKDFFSSLPLMKHAAPFVFDIDGDGKWELIVGTDNGLVRGFSYTAGGKGEPIWREIEKSFRHVKVERFAVPTVFRFSNSLYMLVGQQDGNIILFTADYAPYGAAVFYRGDSLPGIRLNNHSAPSAVERNGVVEISIGDYNGNLKHFVCGRM